jgi:hypothetical protein
VFAPIFSTPQINNDSLRAPWIFLRRRRTTILQTNSNISAMMRTRQSPQRDRNENASVRLVPVKPVERGK